MEQFLTVAEAANILDLSYPAFYRNVIIHGLQGVQVGKRVIFKTSDIEKLKALFDSDPSAKKTIMKGGESK